MEPNNTYKYLSIVLAIIAIIFAVLYFTKPVPEVTDTLNDVTAQMTECRNRLSAWRSQYNDSTSTTESQSAFDDVIEFCQNATSAAQESI